MATRTLAARSPPLHVALGWADKLVEEYLLFRGFVQTHRAFLGEAKHDRLHEFQVDKIVEELLRLLTSFQYHAMMDLWAFLQERFFSRLQHSYWPVVRHLELSLQRFYFVNAIQNDRLDKVRELLESEGERMRSTQDWTQWFQLPFIRDPASDPVFHIYFTKEWASRLVVSVHNLLTTVFHDVPLPALVTQHFNSLQLHMLEHQAKEQEEMREKLQAENLALRNKLRQAETKVARAGHANANAEGLAAAAQSPAQPQIFQEGMMHSGISGTGGDGGAEGDEVPIEVCPAARSGHVGRGEGELAMCKVVHEVSFPSHNGPVKRCVFSGAGSTIASASSDATVRVHDLPGTGPATDRSATICCAAPVSSLSWEKRSDRLLLLGSVAGEISVWDVDEKKMALELQSDPAFPRVCDLSASPDGVSLVAACATTQQSSSVLQAYSLRSGKLMQTLEGKGDGSIRALHYNHNGSLLAAGTSQGMLQLYDVRSGGVIMEWKAHQASFGSVLFGADETSLFSSGADGFVREWSAHMSGKELWSHQASSFETHVSIAVSPEGSQLVAAFGETHLDVCSVKRGANVHGRSGAERVGAFESPVVCLDCSPETGSDAEEGRVAILCGTSGGLVKAVYLRCQ